MNPLDFAAAVCPEFPCGTDITNSASHRKIVDRLGPGYYGTYTPSSWDAIATECERLLSESPIGNGPSAPAARGFRGVHLGMIYSLAKLKGSEGLKGWEKSLSMLTAWVSDDLIWGNLYPHALPIRLSLLKQFATGVGDAKASLIFLRTLEQLPLADKGDPAKRSLQQWRNGSAAEVEESIRASTPAFIQEKLGMLKACKEQFASFCSALERRVLEAEAMIGIRAVKDVEGLLMRLKAGSDPVSAYLATVLSVNSIASASTQAVSTDLVSELNRVIRGPSVYEKARFEKATLRASTERQISQNLSGEQVWLLNRCLLEDAYQGLIVANPGPDLKVVVDGMRRGMIGSPDEVSGGMLKDMLSRLGETPEGGVSAPGQNSDPSPSAGDGRLRQPKSPEEALAMLDGITSFYSKHQPSSPVPLFIARARGLVGASFPRVISELFGESAIAGLAFPLNVSVSKAGPAVQSYLPEGIHYFVEHDLIDVEAIRDRLSSRRDNLSSAIWSACDDARGSEESEKLELAQKMIQDASLPSQEQRTHLLVVLNHAVRQNGLFERASIGLNLSAQTLSLAESKPKGGDLARLNRLLMQEGFAGALRNLASSTSSGSPPNSSAGSSVANPTQPVSGVNAGQAALGATLPLSRGFEYLDSKEVLVGLDLVCRYFSSSEPSSPIPILLQKARAFVDADLAMIVKRLLDENRAALLDVSK